MIGYRGYVDENCVSPNKLTDKGSELAAEMRALYETLNVRFKTFPFYETIST